MKKKTTKKVKNIADLVNLVIAEEDTYAWLDYQYLLEDEVKKLSKKIGIPLRVNKRVISTDDIKHAYDKHSLDGCPLEWSDFVLIDIITKHYDSVKIGYPTLQGLNTIADYLDFVNGHKEFYDKKSGECFLPEDFQYKGRPLDLSVGTRLELP